MTTPKVTLLIPNYKTPTLTKLCLRSIRKYTDPKLAKVIVIDNDSQDASLEYLRSLKWITLIERQADPQDSPAMAHAHALDAGLVKVDTPFVLSIHTDTIVKHPFWLPFLLKQIIGKKEISGVGSWKLESKPFIKRWAKKLERLFQLAWYRLTNKKEHAIQGAGKNYYYLRSHCALYRTELIQRLNVTFSENNNTAGKEMHRRFAENGYDSVFLSSETLGQYIDHINHATAVLNPELGSRRKTIVQGARRIKKSLKKLHADEILADARLDQ